MDLESELRKIAGKNVLTSTAEMIPYSRDASYFEGDLPSAVVIPEDVEELSKVVRFCNENEVQIVTRGGGSSLTGSSILNGKGIVLVLSKLNRILEVKVEDRYVIAEAGVRLDDLNDELSKHSHFYPPDPASSKVSTVGGTIATNAGGLRGAMYGVTKDWVLGLEVVLPSGETVQLGGKTLKRSAGYDLASLMIGSEGTLGIITKATLKIWPRPEKIGRILSFYESIQGAGKALTSLKARGINPLIAEFMDKIAMDSINYTRGMQFPEKSRFMLMIDIASTLESVDRQLSEAVSVIKDSSPITITVTKDEGEMQKMYEARKGLYSSILSQRVSTSEYIVIGDVVVPASELPSALIEIERAIESHLLKVALFGHIGDGNIHANIFADVSNKEKMDQVEDFQMEIGRIALRHGGSVSAEHGIGIEKKELLKEEFKETNSPGTLELMKIVKRSIDPKNLLNRGKIFDI